MDQFENTRQFSFGKENSNLINEILLKVDSAMKDKGYDSISQIVGYIVSGDPAYITSHENARYLIRRFERDEILEELVRFYLEENREN